MVKKKNNSVTFIGSWAFLIGVVLAFIFGISGFLNTQNSIREVVSYVLVILGIIVGLLNVKEKEVGQFLLAGVSLVIVSSLGSSAIMFIAPWLFGVLNAILIMFVPTTIIVAVKHVFNLAKY